VAVGEESWRDPAVLDALSRASIEALTQRPAPPAAEPLARRNPRPAAGEMSAADGLTAATPISRRRHTDPPVAPAVLEAALQQAAVGLALLDAEHLITWVNTAACTMLARTAEELIGVSPEFLEVPSAINDALADRPSDVWTPRPKPNEWRECRGWRPDGTEFPVMVHSGAVPDTTGHPASYLLQLVDPARCRTAATSDGHLPLVDSLTGLPGRSLLLDRLQHALARSERSGSAVAVVRLRFDMAQMDGGRPVHIRRVFLAASRRLQAALRATDTVAFVGDGFILVCEEIIDSEVRTVADRVIEAVRAPFNLDGRPTPVTIRAGVAVGRAPVTSSNQLLDEAEADVH
jgi:PAS domain S-box-containing protein